MIELLTAIVGVVAVLVISCVKGRARKQAALARALHRPDEVVRIYLKSAHDMEAPWLYIAFRTGRPQVVAAPWDVTDTLAHLARAGLRLSEADAEWLLQREQEQALAQGNVQAGQPSGLPAGLSPEHRQQARVGALGTTPFASAALQRR